MLDEDNLTGSMEWCSWTTTSGYVTLPDDRRVLVQEGDSVLIMHTTDGCTILAHRPAVRQ